MAADNKTQPFEIVTRAEAKARGLKFYFTGKPCLRRGHIGFRYVNGSGDCVECANLRARATSQSKSDWRTKPENCERLEAEKQGLKCYHARKPCRRCHGVVRYVVNNMCVKCACKNARKWHDQNPEIARENHKRKYLENREEILKQNAEYQAALKRDNPKEAKRRARRYRRAWENKNRERCRVKVRNRRARQRAGGTHTKAEIEALAERQGYKCANPKCRKSIRKKRHADHIVPLKLGGSNDIKNIQLLCPHCNHRKSAKHPIDWARENGLLL